MEEFKSLHREEKNRFPKLMGHTDNFFFPFKGVSAPFLPESYEQIGRPFK
jgi:hypothetical protein